MSKLTAFKNESYLQSSLSLLLFFASWGVWWSFFQLWLTSESNGLGLSGSAVGTIFSANSFVTLILMFFYGTLQDKLYIKRTLLIFSAILATLVGPFFIWIYAPLLENNFNLGLLVGSLFLSAAYLASVGVFEAVTERFSRLFSFEYGQARAWGSFGYALVALAAGFLFVKDPHLNFWTGSFFGLLLLLNLLFWKPKAERVASEQFEEAQASSTPSLKEMFNLLKLPELWTIIIFIVFTWTFYTVFDQQMFPDFYTGLFASQADGEKIYGTLNAIQVFCEALMMGVVPIIMRKLGIRNTLLLGVTIMCARIGLCGFATTPVTVSIIKMLHALEVPLFTLPMFRYFTLHFDTKLSATLYMIGFQIAAQIGQVILSTPLGILRDSVGYQSTFKLISLIVLAAGIYAFFILKKDHEDVLGDPFIRS
ncbi:MFS transporter [Dolosicoccus paucivorans]|uniref:MFS transporter n=1 Tax=Dolosicoccus paucivorans TaxID=84521 RepID=A0A2N6SNH1_9LACT|nr:MFS transporter [Dolosicoccus paucivorans]PMB84467.1 MFS transporter [Dolosicoccus paucivorans]PMC58602.1 MFS transporter [Dolosicoccus paucivorans]